MAHGKIEQDVKMAALIAIIMSILTIISVIISKIWGLLSISWWSLMDVILLLGLAYGIYKKSRICAVLLFILFVLNQIILFIDMGTVITLPIAIVFGYLLLKGVQATFIYHKKKGPNNTEKKVVEGGWYKRFDLLSFWLSIVVWSLLSILVVISLLIINTSIIPTSFGTVLLFIFLALVLFGNLLFSLAGIGLGITSLVKYKDRKLFAILGIVLNLLFVGPYFFSIPFFV
ncbi:hypothetical protein [Lederbergia ruris]|uniref:hypothetical protein n=1 Tax=Lederbergia ruris TaxID=217495 RepID=UPI0039A292FD